MSSGRAPKEEERLHQRGLNSQSNVYIWGRVVYKYKEKVLELFVNPESLKRLDSCFKVHHCSIMKLFWVLTLLYACVVGKVNRSLSKFGQKFPHDSTLKVKMRTSKT